MICVSLSDTSPALCLKAMEHLELAEIRLDLTDFDDDSIRVVFGSTTKTVATCRPGKITETERLRRLLLAIEAGASYVDVETESSQDFIDQIVTQARQEGADVIVSYHNFEGTPSANELEAIVGQCFRQGADVAKLAVMSHNRADVARILSLYGEDKRLVAFGMGDAGKISRALAPLLGAEFTFAAPDDGAITAPGQVACSVLKEQIAFLQKI